jgi:hypothetical protein
MSEAKKRIKRFWSQDAAGVRCVRESDYDRDVQALREEVFRQSDALEDMTADRDGCAHQRDALAAENLRLREQLAMAVAACEDPRNRTMHTLQQQCRFLDGLRAALSSGKEVV